MFQISQYISFNLNKQKVYEHGQIHIVFEKITFSCMVDECVIRLNFLFDIIAQADTVSTEVKNKCINLRFLRYNNKLLIDFLTLIISHTRTRRKEV